MILKTINGLDLKNMVYYGLESIKANEDKVNDLNVFPVPDGDTGTNMKMTFTGGYNELIDDINIGIMAKNLAKGCLLGARGNSGVILSQIFKGFSKGFKGLEVANALDFSNALVLGYEQAYKTVETPTEGTMLTVAREGIELIKDNVNSDTTINEIVDMYLDQMKITLQKTPELLPVLREAGVVDSGGVGLITIFIGIKQYLDSDGKEEILTKVIEEEVNVIDKSSIPHKNVAFVAVASGTGMADLFIGQGVDVIINGGQTMNPSAKDFIDAYNKVNADTIVVFPNNKNIILSAKQSAELVDENIIVLETRSMAECYSALGMMIDGDVADLDEQLNIMNEAIKSTKTLSITKAICDSTIYGVEIKEGEYITFLNDKYISHNTNKLTSIDLALASMELDDICVAVVYKGALSDIDEAEELVEKISDTYELECGIIEGEQDVYDFIIGLS